LACGLSIPPWLADLDEERWPTLRVVAGHRINPEIAENH
jgi:hypothetical protein